MIEDLLIQRRDVLSQMEDKSTSELWSRLNALNRALGIKEEAQDPLCDEWERDLAEGRMPDLTKGVADGA